MRGLFFSLLFFLKYIFLHSIDVIIVSDAKTPYLRSLTEQAITTAIGNSGSNVEVYVFVVEKQNIDYELATTIKQTGEFCYNKYLNEGAAMGASEFICFANNDLIFHQDWAIDIIEEMNNENVSSASPFCSVSALHDDRYITEKFGNIFGYNIRNEFLGWCFVWSRILWEDLKLDETMSFWASDNVVADDLERRGIKHMLCTSSLVTHLNNGSHTLKSETNFNKHKLTIEEVKKYNKLFGKNLFNLGQGEKQLQNEVSVIVPVYGDIEKWEPFYQRAIGAINSQTLKPKYILISIANDLQSARNRPAMGATTEWILFCDADDTLDENYVEEMMKLSADADIVVPSAHRYFANGEVDKSNYWYEPKNLLTGNYITIGAMIRTELFINLGGFKDLPALEDFEFYIRAEEAGARFVHCPKAIYKINVREGSRNTNQELAPQIINEAKKRRGITA